MTIPHHKPKNFTITDNVNSLNLSWDKPGDFKENLTYKLDKIIRDGIGGETQTTLDNINSTSTTDNKDSSENFVYYELTANYI